ncbi:MAG: SufD family Fe-S cluster assembly protein [Candidatus Anstonellales archaeon]
MEERVIYGKEEITSKKSMRIVLMENAEVKARFAVEDRDVNIEIFHRGKNSKSDVVLKGFARKKVNLAGRLRIEKGADGSEGNLIIKGLSDGGRIEVVPAIEVYEENARAGHGASIQEMDEEILFYLRSRGIGKRMAKKIIVESFLNYL